MMHVSWLVRMVCYLIGGVIAASFYLADRPIVGGKAVHWHLGFLVVWFLTGTVGACACGFISERTFAYLQLEAEQVRVLPVFAAFVIATVVMFVFFGLASFAIASILELLTY